MDHMLFQLYCTLSRLDCWFVTSGSTSACRPLSDFWIPVRTATSLHVASDNKQRQTSRLDPRNSGTAALQFWPAWPAAHVLAKVETIIC
jgi:hypothetical protein